MPLTSQQATMEFSFSRSSAFGLAEESVVVTNLTPSFDVTLILVIEMTLLVPLVAGLLNIRSEDT